MKEILCFGDSNTYGLVPGTCKRYSYDIRWTGILADRLGKDYHIVEEGLCGRTTIFDDKDRPARNGSELLPTLLESHMPLDLVIIMLGTNDCKSFYNASAKDIGKGIIKLIEQIRHFDDNIDILIISPIHLGTDVWQDEYDPEFSKESVNVSKQLKSVYKDSEKIKVDNNEIIDGNGAFAIPGLIDLHFHGCKGDDFCDAGKEAIENIAKYECSVGVTSIAPATMTLPVDELENVLRTAAEYNKTSHGSECADLIGINMEGPFISKVKKGAQDERNIIPCNEQVLERFIKASDGLVKFIGIAPEESDNSIEFIKNVKDKVNVSLAHTNADYDTAMKAFEAGANHAVHLYNAMPPFTHRAPGVVGAVSDSDNVMAEIICDGIHIHPSVVRATFKMMGADRMIL